MFFDNLMEIAMSLELHLKKTSTKLSHCFKDAII